MQQSLFTPRVNSLFELRLKLGKGATYAGSNKTPWKIGNTFTQLTPTWPLQSYTGVNSSNYISDPNSYGFVSVNTHAIASTLNTSFCPAILDLFMRTLRHWHTRYSQMTSTLESLYTRLHVSVCMYVLLIWNRSRTLLRVSLTSSLSKVSFCNSRTERSSSDWFHTDTVACPAPINSSHTEGFLVP